MHGYCPIKPEVINMKIHYLEIVSLDADAVCSAYEASHGVRFGAADNSLGGARILNRPDGSIVGVRAPLHESEEPVVRPYWLVANIKSALAEAEKQGGEVIHSPLEIPGKGTFAIYVQGSVQHGLWQL